MALKLETVEEKTKPKIVVFGVGGAGGSAVDRMIDKNLAGLEFCVANTDSKAITASKAPIRILLGENVAQGLGAGMRPEIGRQAAEESFDEIVRHLAGADMCLVVAGMGGGNGTGAAPVIAKAARDLGMLTIGVATKPFAFEGQRRQVLAEQGLDELRRFVDALFIIPNQNLFKVATENTTILEAFGLSDEVLCKAVRGITDILLSPGLINVDLGDMPAVLGEMGNAAIGFGEATGEARAIEAANKALASPLLAATLSDEQVENTHTQPEEKLLPRVRGVIVNITGGYDLKLFEIDEAANRITQEIDPSANIVVGSIFDYAMQETVSVTVLAIEPDLDGRFRRERKHKQANNVDLPSDKLDMPAQQRAVLMAEWREKKVRRRIDPPNIVDAEREARLRSAWQALRETIADLRESGSGGNWGRLDRALARYSEALGSEFDDLNVIALGVHGEKITGLSNSASEFLMPDAAEELAALARAHGPFIAQFEDWRSYLEDARPEPSNDEVSLAREIALQLSELSDLVAEDVAKPLVDFVEDAAPENSPDATDKRKLVSGVRNVLAALFGYFGLKIKMIDEGVGEGMKKVAEISVLAASSLLLLKLGALAAIPGSEFAWLAPWLAAIAVRAGK